MNFSSADVPSFDCPFPEGSDMAICTMSIDFRTGGSRPLGEQVKHSAAGTPFGECLGDRTYFSWFWHCVGITGLGVSNLLLFGRIFGTV